MRDHYLLFAELLTYPSAGLAALAGRLGAMLEGRSPETQAKVLGFAAELGRHDLDALEELYIRTFDIRALCCLDCGYQLFGETYKRGVFLVKMRQALRAHEIPEGSELPDHLPSVLRLLGRLPESGDPRGLCDEVVVPALYKMLAGFANEPSNPYEALLRALTEVIERDFAIVPEPAVRNLHLPVVPDRLASQEFES